MATVKSKAGKQAKKASGDDAIVIHGARMNNLKNVTVAIPRNKLVVVTGVSGSGKSTLTMDTLFAEGQRRYAESLSAYARQFLVRMDKPDVDYIDGIAPAIAIEQKVSTRSIRSTVGSLTEILDYLRLLFGRAGHTFSPVSGKEVKKDEVSDVVDFIVRQQPGDKMQILIPFVTRSGRTAAEECAILLQKGFTRLFIKNGEQPGSPQRLEDILTHFNEDESYRLPQGKIFILIDRLVGKETFEEDDRHRLADSVQTAFYESDGTCIIEWNGHKLVIFDNKFEADGMVFEVPVPNLFSFNNPYGACPHCEGLGQVLGIDYNLVMPDHSVSVYDDAVLAWKGEKMHEWKQAFIQQEAPKGFPIHKPLSELSKEQWQVLTHWVDDFFRMISENLYKIQYRVMQARYRGRTVCPECHGSRLRKDALFVKVGDKNIAELSEMPADELYEWFRRLSLNKTDSEIARRILQEINQRLKTLLDVGLGYLSMIRYANTLSGGESQRIQLTRFLGSNLTDSLYILDEPSIGLHPRDTDRLIHVLKNLRDLNNTVVVVEHDEMVMEQADYIIDMGPLAAQEGGEVVAVGNAGEIKKNPQSLTGKYLSGRYKVTDFLLPEGVKKRALNKPVNFIRLEGCREHNLKNIDVAFPLNCLCVVTGVSGSGKTTLVKDTLYPAMLKELHEPGDRPGQFRKISGDIHAVTRMEMVDQNPIGKSSRSNPVSYIKAYDDIRNLFAKQQLAKVRGFLPRHFSFNVDGGRCDTCKGEGEVVVEMQFLADVHLVCESCHGRRFKDEVLEVTYRGKNIYDVLNMTVDEAIAFFKDETGIAEKLKPLQEVGLGYVKLGQSSSTLSGGEAQRVKLASFLGKGSNKEQVLFIFDEPTTGLHFHDISKLLKAFFALIREGHSVIVIEHNTDIIRNADWLIDIGPEGGKNGGRLLYAGVPEGIKKVRESYTAQYL